MEAVQSNIEGIVLVKFIIDKEGKAINVEALGPKGAKILESVSKRLVEKLPVLNPAIKDGVPVHATYDFPIEFSLKD